MSRAKSNVEEVDAIALLWEVLAWVAHGPRRAGVEAGAVPWVHTSAQTAVRSGARQGAWAFGQRFRTQYHEPWGQAQA